MDNLSLLLLFIVTFFLAIIAWKLFSQKGVDTSFFEEQILQEKLVKQKIEDEKNKIQEENFRLQKEKEILQNDKIKREEELKNEEQKNVRLETEIQNKKEEIVRLETEEKNFLQEKAKISEELENAEKEKNLLEGRGKETFARYTKLDEENKMLKQERDILNEKLTKFESTKTSQEKEFLEKIEKLEHSREKLEKEQHRIIREDEEELKNKQEEQDRIWNEHENLVLSELREVCQMPETGFLFYENSNLPAEFDGSLKPDFMISFLGQYLIFDAKKSKNPKTYIDDQVKKTAKKCKGNDSIYSTIFFVMPKEEVEILKKRFFYEEGYSFFVISPESLLPTVLLLKKITEYKNIEDFDPKDREAIVNLVAQYDRHISYQNAANFVLAKKSIELMDSKQNLPEKFQAEIETTKNSMKDIRLNPSEIKKYAQNTEKQLSEISALSEPKAKVEKKMMKNIEEEAGGLF
jgi:hypothetical protein